MGGMKMILATFPISYIQARRIQKKKKCLLYKQGCWWQYPFRYNMDVKQSNDIQTIRDFTYWEK